MLHFDFRREFCKNPSIRVARWNYTYKFSEKWIKLKE